MFTLQKLLSLPVFLSTTLIAHAVTAPQGFIDENEKDNPRYAAALTGGEECGDEDLDAIRQGFAEMNRLFQAALYPDWTREPELEFFGRQERISNYTDMIEGNLRRAAQYGNVEGDATRNPDIHVRCDDPNNICDEGNEKEGQHTAYNIGNEPHINFCRTYFDLDPLDEEVDDEVGNEQSKHDLLNYYNRATAWARMVMHISSIGTAIVVKPGANTRPNATSEWTMITSEGPMNTSVLGGVMDSYLHRNGPTKVRTLKYAFGVARAKLLATLSTQNAYDAANNAENYALYAQVRYVIQKKNFFPDMPIMDFGNDMAVLTNKAIQDGDRRKFACFEMSDVVPRKEGTNLMGSPLPSSAPARARNWHTQTVVLIWVILSCLGTSAL